MEKIKIWIDGKFYCEPADYPLTRGEIEAWFLRVPFWEQSCLVCKMFKKYENADPKETEIDIERPKIDEKNLFFMDSDNPYVCLRCRQPSEIVGFCSNCYNVIYGMDDKEEFDIPLEDVICNEKFIMVVEADPEYTEKIKQSIIKDGMKNPIVIDKDNKILIGHHRYYIAKDLGWKTIRAKRNNIKFNHGYFQEGKGDSVFVARIDGELVFSSTDITDVYGLVMDFGFNSMGDELILECFINFGSDIRLRNVFIPERGDVVDPTWYAWYVRKFNKKPKIGKFS